MALPRLLSMRRPQLSRTWNAQYAEGRYLDEPPVPFVDDIIRIARDAHLSRGLYVGCGNGRNLVPLRRAGLDLLGLDLSETALHQAKLRLGPTRSRLVCGTLEALRPESRFDLIVAIQVFQHGTREQAHAHIRHAQRRLAVGGSMCVRVNSVTTDVFPAHEVVERGADDSFTVRYAEGPKTGVDIHFFSGAELDALFDGFEVVIPPREDATERTPPEPGRWTQWEAIWRRTAAH